MTDIYSLNILDLIPPSIAQDPDIRGIADALSQELIHINHCINEAVMIPRIDELPEDIIDSLAWQFHVDFYEPLGLELETKRALVKNSLDWHRRKGTKSVLEEMLSVVFAQACKVVEWFEYGGKPYFFKVWLDNVPVTEKGYEYILRAVYELKNVRSWLESIVVENKPVLEVFAGQYVCQTVKHEIGWFKDAPRGDTDVFVGTIASVSREWFVPYKEETDLNLGVYTQRSDSANNIFTGVTLDVLRSKNIEYIIEGEGL